MNVVSHRFSDNCEAESALAEEQHGFLLRRSTAHMVLFIRLVQNPGIPLFLSFID